MNDIIGSQGVSQCVSIWFYVVPSVVAAHLSVKQVERVRFPGSTQKWVLSLKVEHPPYKWDTAERYRQEVPTYMPLV